MARVRRNIERIAPNDSVERYEGLGVECVRGEAYIESPFAVRVGDRTITTRNIVVATGASPIVPPIPGIEAAGALTSETVWGLECLPARLVVVGGGPIGCELAQCFARFGSRVSQIQTHPRLLPREDPEFSELVAERLRADGVEVLTGYRASAFTRDGERKTLACQTPDGGLREIEFDEVILAVGRAPRTKGFGLEALGIETAPGGVVETDAFLATRYPNIFACGDVAGPYQFTHTASHQAWYAAVNALFGGFKRFRADYSVVPWATFTDPEVARVGLNESEASARGVPFEVTRYGFDDLDRAIADSEAHGMIKVLTAPGKDRILGATVAGEHAGDLLMEFVLAMRHGLGAQEVARHHPHLPHHGPKAPVSRPGTGGASTLRSGCWRGWNATTAGEEAATDVIGRTPPVGLVATDLDGTLLGSDHTLGPRDAEALRQLGQDGVVRVVATGRSLRAAERVLDREFPIDYLAVSSGAGILDWKSRRLLRRHGFETAGAERVAEVLNRFGVDFMAHAPVPGRPPFPVRARSSGERRFRPAHWPVRRVRDSLGRRRPE